MSWKYTVPYTSRDLTSSRDTSTQSKYGTSPITSKFGSERQSRWSANNATADPGRNYRVIAPQTEQSPMRAKTIISDNPSSVVQRLKERYSSTNGTTGEDKLLSRRPYGRSLTTLSVGTGATMTPKTTSYEAENRRPTKLDVGDGKLFSRSPEQDKTCSYKKVEVGNTVSETKTCSPKSPSTYLRFFPGKPNQDNIEPDCEMVTVVARGTSPSQTTSSIYLRTRRADFGIEKKIKRPKIKPPFSHKETQTDKTEELHVPKYLYSDTNSRIKPWTGSTSTSRFSRTGTTSVTSPTRNDYHGLDTTTRRSISRESSSLEPKTPDSAPRSPESPGTPKNIEENVHLKSKPPTSFRSTETIKLTVQKPVPSNKEPDKVRKPLKIEPTSTSDDQAKSPTPNCIADRGIKRISPVETPKNPEGKSLRSPPRTNHSAMDGSSMSESSSESETSSSDEEVERIRSSKTSFVKRSITNFLQNLPNPRKHPSTADMVPRPKTFQKLNGQLGPPKITFNRVESGERAWWMDDSSEKSPQDVQGIAVSNCVSVDLTNSLVSDETNLDGNNNNNINGKDESETDSSEKVDSNGFPNAYSNTDESSAEFIEDSLDVTPALRRRREQSRGRSPENSYQQDGKISSDETECKKSGEQLDMKDRPHQNGIGGTEEKDIGDMSGMISKAKAGLAKSKSKLDVKKSSSREMSPKLSEIDLYWKELVESMNRPLRLCDLDFTDLNTDDETDLFGFHREEGEIPPPPPMLILPPANPLKVPVPPMAPAKNPRAPAPPPTIQSTKNKKTVKLFWKEVKSEPMLQAKMNSLIWDELAKVSVDTQKLEHLFESRAKDLITKKQQEQNKSKEIIVLDNKRSNAINIGMTKLPPPRAIKTAILKMDSTVVNKEGIEKLLTMLPTEEERLRIQDAQSSNPDLPLGSAEQFLLILASITELEARLKLWAFKLDFENSEKEICEPLMDLKQGIEILKTNKTFRAILSTLLSVGNFLNGCEVKGFQIDYLSKVPEVKDTVQKHSLLHHLCAIVMEKFPESTDLYSEIGAVTRASKVDFDELTGNIKKIEEECKLSWNYLKLIAKHEGHTAMKVKMSDFLADCAERIIVLGTVHKRILSRFHKFIFWLGIPINRISITRPNEIFKVISEFALEYRTTRDRILQQLKKMNHREKNRSRGYLAGEANDNPKKMNSKEAKDDAKLRQLLGNESTYSENSHNTSTWRRHRKDTRNLIEVANNNDDEIIETLIKTANQIPSHRPTTKDRRRNNRIIERHY